MYFSLISNTQINQFFCLVLNFSHFSVCYSIKKASICLINICMLIYKMYYGISLKGSELKRNYQNITVNAEFVVKKQSLHMNMCHHKKHIILIQL